MSSLDDFNKEIEGLLINLAGDEESEEKEGEEKEGEEEEGEEGEIEKKED